jgi:hypothetical protein
MRLEEVVREARKEYQSSLKPKTAPTPIYYSGKIVGVYHPHSCKYGRRIGPIFVLPEYRGRGIALGIYNSISGELVACVRDDNIAGIRLHEAAGFIRFRRYQYGWWMVRK